MNAKVWVVQVQETDSWVGEPTDSYYNVGIHATQKGAETSAAARRLDEMVSAITRHELDQWNGDADEVLGAIEDEDVKDALKQRASVPGADFIKAMQEVVEARGIDVLSVRVDERPLLD